MNAAEFLAIAEQFRNSPKEAERRTSIGRSYYALFNLARERFDDVLVFRALPEDHKNLIKYLKLTRGTPSKLGHILEDLRNRRNDADYRMNLLIDEQNSQLAFQFANSALNHMQALSEQDFIAIKASFDRLA